LYNGILEIVLDDENVAQFYEKKYKYDYSKENLLINQYVVLKNKNNKVLEKGRWDGNSFVELSYPKIEDFKPISIKQEFLCDLLSNMNIPIKIVGGIAGSGKTKIAMTFGFHFLSKQKFNRFFVVRHNVPVGERNGFLPGDKFEKIRGWLGFFEDNLDGIQYTIEEMIDRKMLDVDSPEYMKGRDLKNSWILIDEAEDLSEDQFKMIGERISAGSVMCFVGDYEQTTQDKYKNSSGLKRAINKLAGNPKVGIVVFDDKENDNVRSEASKIFSFLY
jgi:PhoH-like ATPase